MTNEQSNRLILMLDALRIAVLTTIPSSEQGGSEEGRAASDRIAENALEAIVDVGGSIPTRS
ncbi:hypothetical protein LCGC14_1776630 [marine sediment metagenome]|uniref:Uncharacterized protein n=1 Tax=marine sediment metagenome TaxID=412755 RepID=A0A0F9HJ70_9ZZZZ